MASSKLIKKWISDKKKTAARVDRELKATKARIKKLEGDLKKAVAKEKAAAAKKKPARKAPAKKKPVKKKRAPAKKKPARKKVARKKK
jgi:hypothetical protein